MMNIAGNGVYADMIKTSTNALNDMAKDIRTDMQKIANLSSEEDKQLPLMELNFKLGQYNAMVELTTNLIKNLSDSLKTIAQKV